MKNNNINPSKPKTVQQHTTKLEIRDDLDSRKNEEYDFKGDDVTHNKKETKAGKKKFQHGK
jgi:hypothetical protein